MDKLLLTVVPVVMDPQYGLGRILVMVVLVIVLHIGVDLVEVVVFEKISNNILNSSNKCNL
ncbi:hypothetical protein [Williamwhitmania taraxaci]|uniref:hypothetical protein n=1 Tax=Williamwhitmania taraxaci TaxID=1640674 RepID=UPI000B80A9B9|nr:hypothetical protein [Williamwhitmania taraxaci]